MEKNKTGYKLVCLLGVHIDTTRGYEKEEEWVLI